MDRVHQQACIQSQKRIKFINKIYMKIERKTLTKWEINQSPFQENTFISPNLRQEKHKDQQLRTMFGLPRSIVESPKLGQLKKMMQDNHANKLNNPSGNLMGPAGQCFHNFRKTLTNRTNERLRPLRKHNSLLETYELHPESQGQRSNQLPMTHHMGHHQHNSSHTLQILQKIIFKQDNSPQQKEKKMELHANKLPIIDYSKELKKKESTTIYQQKYFVKTVLNRQKPFYSRPRQKERPSEKPYLTAWETESRNW